jgi:hypothetical protein
MGLFNSITVNREFILPLPANLGELTVDEIYSGGFQTKDLEYGMNYYTIHEDGSMTEEVYSWGDDESKIKEVRVVSKPQLINFYNHYVKENNDYWIEFQYLFDTESKITLTQFKVTPNAEKKALKAAWDKKWKDRETLLNKWYMKPYNWYAAMVRFVFRKYDKIKEKLPSSWQVERFLTPL